MSYKPNLVLEQNVLKVRNADAIKIEQSTRLTSSASSGASTLTVQNIAGFGVDDYIVIGRIGDEKSELVKLHASTAPSGTTITLSSTIARSHPRDTVIQKIAYNQVEFSRATTSGGSKSVLTTTDLTVDREFTVYNDTTNSTGFGYARFKNATASTFSDYSDEEQYPFWKQNSVGRIIDSIYSRANEVDETFVSRVDVLGFIQDFIDDVNDRKKRWRHEEASLDKSNTTTLGGETFTLPTSIKYLGNESIDTIYIENEPPLSYIGQDEWAERLVGVARSTLNGGVSSGATSITLYDATNFSDDGTGYIDGDAFTWTSKSGNTLSGVSGILDHDSGDAVWQETELGAPAYYSILNGVGRLYPAPDDDYDTRPLVIAFTERLTYPDSENDELPIPYLSACKEYCLMCVEDKKGKSGNSNKYEQRYERKIDLIVRREKTGQPRAFRSKVRS